MEAKFVCNLKKYRVAQELTQEQLADIVGVRRETIMRLEKAQYNPSLKLAIDISSESPAIESAEIIPFSSAEAAALSRAAATFCIACMAV